MSTQKERRKWDVITEEKMRRNYWDTLYVNLTWANCYASAPPLSGFIKNPDPMPSLVVRRNKKINKK